jgi:hypothetical protein
MIHFFGRLMKLPLEAFVYGMEMLAQAMRGMQHIAYQGIDMMADRDAQVPVDASGGASASRQRSEATQRTLQEEEREMSERDMRERDWRERDTHERDTRERDWRERDTRDKDLRDDKVLKLVRYKILFVKRDYEHAFPEKEELVSEDTDTAGYTAWKIAEFIQDLKNIEIPKKWRDKKYPRNVELTSPPEASPKINELPEDDKKYLRIYYEVLQRYRREEFRYQERQIEVLEQIRDRLKDP